LKFADRVGALREGSRTPLLFQILSLYLLLLAFFVVLNAISHVENARSRAVTGSLNETFAAQGTPTDETRSLTSSTGAVVADAAFTKRVGNLIRTELELAEIEEVEPGRLLAVRAPADSFFVPGRAAIDPLHRRLVERVADAMKSPAAGIRYDVDIMLGVAGRDGLATRRAAYLASVFAAAGAPARNVAAGIEHGTPGRLSLLFHIRPLSEGRMVLRDGSAR
jgi:hypothetical protein